jgi:hypothetical protein
MVTAGPEPNTYPAPVIEPLLAPAGKWAEEHRAFRRLLPELLPTHRGQYVAVHEGKVIATGPDKVAVALEAFRQAGNVPIHVGLVSEEPEPAVRSGVRRVPPPDGGAA